MDSEESRCLRYETAAEAGGRGRCPLRDDDRSGLTLNPSHSAEQRQERQVVAQEASLTATKD